MDLSLFYGKNYHSSRDERAKQLYDYFVKKEGKKPEYILSSPGRAEILGNHTDHNHGKVMVASINCDILCFASPVSDGSITLYSEGYPPIRTTVDDDSISKEEYGTSLALVKGVCTKLRQLGYTFGGFVAYNTSNIFKGAGVSSSAAFEVLICEIINLMYLDGKLDPITKAIVSQFSENVYFGKPCGLLDQSGIALGSLSKLDFNTPEKPLIRTLTAPEGYTLVLTNTGGDHAKLTQHYAAIRTEMESIAQYFGEKVLRDVDEEKFLASMPELKAKFSSRAILRAIHFYNENKRVDLAEKALDEGDSIAFLNQVASSGLSSMSVLQNCYVPGETNQPVMLAIEYSKQITKKSFFRVHGGGFAGSILAFVENSELEGYVDSMKKVFGDANVFTAQIRATGTCGYKL
ncbi:MAG: galactokinase [Clostridiales bacterium]|nr:galactokinase [Clostridiales bacterium]